MATPPACSPALVKRNLMTHLEAQDRADTFVPHAFEERVVDLDEIRMNYATVGEPAQPALLLLPSQSESWWGYEQAMPLLAQHFQVFAVDLRGQGRSTWTPGRYTVDVMGGDLVRFIDLVIARPTIVSGLSHVKVPVLFTHHWHQRDTETGIDQGAISDLQADRVRELVTEAGQDFTYLSFPDMPHSMHHHQPELFTRTLTEWAAKLPDTVAL
jgi:pimeloyl-ACP methyl ester carboxylesterase